jgi:F-type H+-transporting ATPase subunit delta
LTDSGTPKESGPRINGYAAALLEVAKAEGKVDRVADELFRFARAIEQNDQLRDALTNASLPAELRQGIVEDLLGARAVPISAALVSFVVGAGRSRDLIAIIDRMVERAAAEEQKEIAEVRSAIPLSDDQQARLAKALSQALDKQVEVKVIVDRSVMGGLVAKVGDTIIDGTVRHRLDQLREVL